MRGCNIITVLRKHNSRGAVCALKKGWLLKQYRLLNLLSPGITVAAIKRPATVTARPAALCPV